MSDEAIAAAEVIAGNGPATAPEPSTEELAKDPLFDRMFAGIAPSEEPKPEAEATEAKPADEAPADEETEVTPEADDLSDDRPWTPERIKNAAALLRADKKRLGSWLHEINTKSSKFKKAREAFKLEKQQVDLVTRRVMTDLESLRVGSADQALAALGRLAQRDPHSLYEQMSLTMLGKAAPSKESAVIAELKSEVASLKEELKAGRQQTVEERTIADAQSQVREVLQAPEEWPILAQRAADAPEQVASEFWQIYRQQCKAAGRWLDVETVADRVERALRRKSMPSHRATNGAAGSGPERVQETRAQSANPEPAQSPPRSLSPSLSATPGGARREPTEDERAAEFARTAPPEFFQQFGF